MRTLKVMDRVFVQRMKPDPQFKDYVDLFFPNLDSVIKIHSEPAYSNCSAKVLLTSFDAFHCDFFRKIN